MFERYPHVTNNPWYHFIVKVENPSFTLQQINSLHRGLPFTLQHKATPHFTPRQHSSHNEFVGNLPWHIIKDRVPQSYSYFYNEYVKQNVAKIFQWDLKLYDYSYPFDS